MEIRSTYLTPLFKRYGSILDSLCKNITKDLNSFDTIVFSGMSGAMIAPMVAHQLKKHFVLIRKGIQEEYRHSWYDVEGVKEVLNYIIIDDGIDKGNTMDRILIEMKKYRPAAFCYKIYLYNQYEINNDFKKTHYKKIPIVRV